jgi:putative transposase
MGEEVLGQTPMDVFGADVAQAWEIYGALDGRDVLKQIELPNTSEIHHLSLKPWRGDCGEITGVISRHIWTPDQTEKLQVSEHRTRQLSMAMQMAKVHGFEFDFQAGRVLFEPGPPDGIEPGPTYSFASRRVLAWEVSISMEADFCVRVLDEALTRHGKPDIFNTDQGSQFTSSAFTGRLLAAGVRISMDGKGCWRDNVFVERLWKSVKYEEVYLRAYETVSQARAGIGRYLDFFNTRRPHTVHRGKTPDQAYFAWLPQTAKAA